MQKIAQYGNACDENPNSNSTIYCLKIRLWFGNSNLLGKRYSQFPFVTVRTRSNEVQVADISFRLKGGWYHKAVKVKEKACLQLGLQIRNFVFVRQLIHDINRWQNLMK